MLQEVNRLPRLVIAAPQGRSGKTTIALGLCAAFRARGLKVQPYKKGPDYIDPSWLSEAAGRTCRSLDPFFYPEPKLLRAAFARSARSADLNLIEGNHGIFDSYDETGLGSTAAVARTLNAPILLVVNVMRTGRSAAAVVHGCQTFEAGTNIAGVVLNNVAQGRHETRVRNAIEEHCRIPVLGAFPRDERLTIPDRHLGLVPRGEGETVPSALAACQAGAEKHLDLDGILRIAGSADLLPLQDGSNELPRNILEPHPKIGIVRDRAFTFYYPENLEGLEMAGAELIYVNALSDISLPDLDALYIGGGFPEIFMDELSANKGMRESVRRAIEHGLPVYAECGGLMYLSQRIAWGDKSAEMVGVLPCEIEMTDKPQGHGYVTAEVDDSNPFFQKGTRLLGHEFHNSRIVGEPLITAYNVTRGNGLGNRRDGIVFQNVLASYTHLHAGGCTNWAESLVDRARLYSTSRLLADK